MQTTTPEITELNRQIHDLMRSPAPSNLAYAAQAIDEIDNLKLFFGISEDVFAGNSSDAEKLKKVEYLLTEFESSFHAWTELVGSVLSDVT